MHPVTHSKWCDSDLSIHNITRQFCSGHLQRDGLCQHLQRPLGVDMSDLCTGKVEDLMFSLFPGKLRKLNGVICSLQAPTSWLSGTIPATASSTLTSATRHPHFAALFLARGRQASSSGLNHPIQNRSQSCDPLGFVSK